MWTLSDTTICAHWQSLALYRTQRMSFTSQLSRSQYRQAYARLRMCNSDLGRVLTLFCMRHPCLCLMISMC